MSKKKFWLIVLSCIGALVFVAAVTVGTIFAVKLIKNEYIIEVFLAGDSEITVVYGEKYEEPGFSAQFYGTHLSKEPIPVDVIVENAVDDQKVGEYELRYTAAHKGVTATAVRKVYVADKEAPVIELVSDPEKYTLPTEAYEEEGFTATDNYDGDITQLVERTEDEGKVFYRVTDSSGNTTEVVREIHYDDPVPPDIVLEGEKLITLIVGTKYQEPGYVAGDNCDGDLTTKVKVTGSVDVDTAGYYTLKYSVTDTYGNTASVSRSVWVKYESDSVVNIPETVVPDGKVIYLTFDDGPGKRTPDLLKILKRYNVKATFFVVDTPYIETIKDIVADGHTIAIHSATHNFKKIYASEESYFSDLNKMKGIIKDLTGVETTLLRFPGGSSNTVSSFNRGIMTRLSKAVVEAGYQYFDWNVDSNDAGGAYTSYQVYKNVISGVKNKKTAIVLQHDIKGFSIDAVEDIILWGLNNGYTFLPLQPNSPGCHHGINN